MAARTIRPTPNRPVDGANLGDEAQLWRAADTLRGNMDAAEHKHVVLDLIFHQPISDAFEEPQIRSCPHSEGNRAEDKRKEYLP